MTPHTTLTGRLAQALCSLCMVGTCMTAIAPTAFATANPNPCPTAPANADKDRPMAIINRDITLLQPLDGAPCTKFSPTAGIQIFFDYFNAAWPWILGCAAGISVGYALYGGILVMLSGADSGKRTEGKDKIMWAIIGLLMIGLAGLFLQTLNPLFYSQV